MVLRIRLARFGTKRRPIYNIVLAQAKSARDKKPMEVLGTYNPIPQTPLQSPETPEFLEDGQRFMPKKQKDVQLDVVRTKYWLGVGAQPTEPVERLLRLIGLVEEKPSTVKRFPTIPYKAEAKPEAEPAKQEA
ncbi:37S ribosomal protein S16, mitochondrial [Cladophialophora chaetospira]|uniref:37S ribosomal protein S16, mitochondrial n=1 Tax=Cladophialophora chaetospira TaxID=386627 RepID=A0AA39CCI7_9EURO|nr:37S ribosomal protein S16, mitochondrial [Cladophialophora chaetospira]